jgi:hypothetical protein
VLQDPASIAHLFVRELVEHTGVLHAIYWNCHPVDGSRVLQATAQTTHKDCTGATLALVNQGRACTITTPLLSCAINGRHGLLRSLQHASLLSWCGVACALELHNKSAKLDASLFREDQPRVCPFETATMGPALSRIAQTVRTARQPIEVCGSPG